MDTRLPPDSEWVRAMSAKLRLASPHTFAPDAPEVSPRPVPKPVPQPAREVPPVEPEPAPAFAPLSSVMRPIAERVERAQEERREAAQRAADYGPIEEMERRIAGTRMTTGTREVLTEGIATIRDEVDVGREEGDRKRVADGLAYLGEIDEFLRDHAAGKLPDL